MNEEITRREALKKGAILSGAALVWVPPSVQTFGMSSTLAAQASGTAGCTPGFWKENPERAAQDPINIDLETTTVGSVFASSPLTSGDSLLQALGYPGGPGEDGAEHILLRAAVAGYLNSIAFPGLYGIGTGGLVTRVNNAIASGNRDTMLTLAASIDMENNQGCLLDAWESEAEPTSETSSEISSADAETETEAVFGGETETETVTQTETEESSND